MSRELSIASPGPIASDNRRTLPSDEAERLMSEALYLHRRGQLTQAETLYREILAASPRDIAALQSLAVVTLQQQRFEEADRLIAAALAIKPDNAEALNNQRHRLARARAARRSAGEL